MAAEPVPGRGGTRSREVRLGVCAESVHTGQPQKTQEAGSEEGSLEKISQAGMEAWVEGWNAVLESCHWQPVPAAPAPGLRGKVKVSLSECLACC